MKIAYIAHPISGDVVGNLVNILDIIREINLNEPDVVPLAPYIGDCLIMDDATGSERARGLKNAIELIKRGAFDEIRLYGDRISTGIYGEIKEALKRGIRVVPMTLETQDDYFNLFESQPADDYNPFEEDNIDPSRVSLEE